MNVERITAQLAGQVKYAGQLGGDALDVHS